ncbi:hypothetical protein EVAR_21218_1 [Eumeta japonica]|uniref:Uncharacterized protein n=1 Tax=Eumeta variegata TaxID=151549 RepID=A0A4C1UPW6_EUMVA|nr:hypothetical protein EVAR_21218_1 [Eumeta japonica]
MIISRLNIFFKARSVWYIFDLIKRVIGQFSREWGLNRSPETIEAGEVSEREAGRMRPDDYRLVFLSSDSSYRDDTEDTASTASSAAAPAPDDCDWDYFEPGAAAAAAPTPAARAPPRPSSQPPSQPSPPCPRPCSCGAEPRIVAVPVPVPVPVPAALWPALLAFPDGAGREPPPPHWSTYPGFPQLDAAALARLTKAAATAAAGVAATLPRTSMSTVDTIDKAIQSEAIEPIVGRGDNADSVLADNKQTDNDSGKGTVEANVSDEIKIIAETGIPVVPEHAETMPDHLEAEKAFASSDDSAESSDDEEGGVCGSYDFKSGAPEEPATSDEDSEDSGGGGGGRFSRVFVVNPADSSSDVEDNADSSGIDCDDGDDKKSDSLEIIAVEVLPDRGQPDIEIEENRCNVNVLRTENVREHRSVIPYGNEPHDDSGSVKCVEFVQFCDPNMFHNVNVEDRVNQAMDSVKIFGHLECESNGNISDFHVSTRENGFSSDSSCSSNESKVKTNEENSNRPGNKTPVICNDVTHDNTKCQSSSESGKVESKISLGKIDLLKGIERKLSELLKKESLEEQLEEKPQAVTAGPVCEGAERGGGGGAPAAAAAVDRSRPAHADGSARYTSRVMITHDRVSVVTTDTTRLMRDVTVHHTNLQSEPEAERGQHEDDDERLSDDGLQRSGDGTGAGVTVVSNSDTLSAVVCLEEGLADDDSWVEDVSHDEDTRTSATDSDSGDEAAIGGRGEDFIGYCRPSLDFTLHTIVEESCEESEAEHNTKKPRPISATELEKYFCFDLGDGRHTRDDEEQVSDASSVCSEGGESLVDNEQPERIGDTDDLVSSRLEKYFLSGFMGFNQERRDSDGSGSVGSDSEGRQSPEHRRKRLVRARGTPRSHSSSLDNLLTGEELAQDAPEVSDGSSTETEDRHDCSERMDLQNENKRKKQNKKTRGSPADERRLSTEFAEENRDDTRSVSEGEDGRLTPRPEFPPLGSELSESKKQTSRDSGFVGSCDDLLRNGDSSGDFSRTHEPKMELEEITEEIRPEIEERTEGPPPRLPLSSLSRKDSFNNWSSDEETNLMMTKMRQFFKQMIASGNVRTSTPSCASSAASGTAGGRPPKPPQLLYFESELTRLMKTVPGIRDEEVREIVEYLSSEDTWSDSYDSSDYAGSDLEGAAGGRSALRRQISESCREIIDEFDRGGVGNAGGAGSLERDAAGAYRRLAATLGRAGEGSPPLFGKVMRHIGGRLVALMHEVSAAASPSTDDDSASEPGALARSRSHDVLEAAASRASVASDSERFSWRGSFESALVAADSRGTLGAPEARRSPPADLAAQRSHSRSCGAIATSEERLWRARRRASAPDAESEEEQARAGSLPRLPSVAGGSACVAGPVKSARYRAPGFRTAIRAASAPGLHVPRRRRPVPAQPHITPPAAPASAPSLQVTVNTVHYVPLQLSSKQYCLERCACPSAAGAGGLYSVGYATWLRRSLAV